jgi:hypothetical protein
VRGNLRGSSVADEEDSDVISLAGAACETLNGIGNRLLEMVQGRIVPASKGFVQTRDAEQLPVGVSSFGDSIAEGDECVACFEFHTGGLVISAGDQSNRSKPFGKWLSKLPHREGEVARDGQH